jgi:hypothetical protein
MNTIDFCCLVSSTDPQIPLGLEIWVDDHQVFDQTVIDQTHTVSHTMSDQDGEHELRFVLKNKHTDHTQLDAAGNIIKDATVLVKNIRFDGIDCDYLVSNMARYQHDFNGHGEPTTQRFYGELGCNGTVSMRFTTPFYLWLLENL